jgi:biopolymer transport protein TolR
MGMSVGTQTGRRGRAAPEMNVTPLVDVVLVLLIIFMVITPLLSKQFWLALPDKQEPEPVAPSDKQPIVVTVTAAGDLRINREVVSDAEFPVRLRRVLAAAGERTVFFDAHENTPFGRASHALDLARGAGAAVLAVATDALGE